MLDLSKYAEDKDNYITRVQISEDFKKFKVIYASGREEEQDFSIHNYQVYLYRMENQFKQYSQDYKREVNEGFFNSLKSSIILTFIDIAGIAVNLSFDTPLWSKILMTFMFSLAIIHNVTRVIDAAKLASFKAMKTAVVDAYLEHKEDFALDVEDTRNGNKEKWYVIDINDLDQFQSVFELSLASIPLRDPNFREHIAGGGLVKMGGIERTINSK